MSASWLSDRIEIGVAWIGVSYRCLHPASRMLQKKLPTLYYNHRDVIGETSLNVIMTDVGMENNDGKKGKRGLSRNEAYSKKL